MWFVLIGPVNYVVLGNELGFTGTGMLSSGHSVSERGRGQAPGGSVLPVLCHPQTVNCNQLPAQRWPVFLGFVSPAGGGGHGRAESEPRGRPTDRQLRLWGTFQWRASPGLHRSPAPPGSLQVGPAPAPSGCLGIFHVSADALGLFFTVSI